MSSLDAALAVQSGRTGPADDRPLTDQEYQLLQRLLSDPFSLPIQFKTWLVSYLETSDMTLPMGSVSGLTAILGISGVGTGTLGTLPAGLIFPYGGGIAPNGSKMCDGTAYSRTVEKRLFDAIGTAYGAPDASSFNVPDLRERIPVGRGSKTGISQLGQNENQPLGSRGPQHNHGSHSHAQARENVSLTPGSTPYSITGSGAGGTTGPSTSAVQVGPSGTPQDGPAFQVVNFIIVS